MRATPRICLTGIDQGDDAMHFAACVASAAVGAGLSVCALVLTVERGMQDSDAVRRLSEATRRSVHRLDPQLMSVDAIRRLTARVAEGADLTLIVSGAPLADASSGSAVSIDSLLGLAAPVCLCIDAAAHRARGESFTAAIERARKRVARHDAAPLALIARAPDPGACDAGTPADSVWLPATLDITRDALVRIIEHAGRAPALPLSNGAMGPARAERRARVGLLVDECFDLHDEESLALFESAGADLVAVSALEGDLPGDLDGLIVGDARVERYSAALATRREFRHALREAIDAGVPTIAAGGGFAYLTRGLRALSGAFHPFVGAIDAEAIVIDGPLPGGPVAVETLVETLIGRVGTRLRGHVDRAWLVRGLPPEERGIYATLAGPPDEGCGQQHLFATHFRPYWPSCPAAATSFLDRCAHFAATGSHAVAESGR